MTKVTGIRRHRHLPRTGRSRDTGSPGRGPPGAWAAGAGSCAGPGRGTQRNPWVIGLMNFGFWTSPPFTAQGGTGASELPLTVDANERVAARILAAAAK
jgi:hypothetical protein